MFKTILVPVDLSDLEVATPAIDAAVRMAEWSGAALRLVNVQQLLPATYMDYVPADFDAQQREWAQAELSKVTARIPLPSERVSGTVRVGGIYPEILAEAEDWGADLIVIGSHRPAMSTYLLGSNAKTVVRHARCSVLVVRT
ncbi:MAG: universal stress protein UspA [Hyphomicrobiales bacterium]|nr:universal stress protein UspA [Hyphomicrobiales bacterium]